MKKHTILSIDDEEDIRTLVQCALQAEGQYHVKTAVDGPDGIAQAIACHPDLILCDMMMPGMDGYEVLAILRANPVTERIPVIMLTAINDRAKVREAIDTGCDYYIVKPFDIGDLLSKVKEVLESPAPPIR